jgi:hypothetical protein
MTDPSSSAETQSHPAPPAEPATASERQGDKDKETGRGVGIIVSFHHTPTFPRSGRTQ